MPRRAAGPLAGLVCLLLAACGSIAPSATAPAAPAGSPAGPPRPAPELGLTWDQIEDVERPGDAFFVPSNLPTGPSGPGTAGHPGHFPGQSVLADVAVAGDRLVAAGYTFIDGAWTADAWVATDPRHWALAAVDTRPWSFAESIAARPGGGFVAVGRAGARPAAWTSTDGTQWTAADVELLPDPELDRPPERMVTVLATDDGMIAGGSVGPELGDRRARFWRSVDGTAWTPVGDDDAFDGVEIVALGWAPDQGYVAVGRLGGAQRATGSAAFASADGSTWVRADAPALADDLVAAVIPATGGGWLAVGSDGEEREAVAWSSTDGLRWARAPREESRLHEGEKIRMTDVVPTAAGYVAIGNFVGVQFGDGTSWLSTDGVTWRRAPLQASLGQGEPEALVAWRDRLVIVGSRGAPDNYIPSAWVGPTAP